MELDRVVKEIKAPIEQVWALLADLGGVDRLLSPGAGGFPAIERVVMEGQGVGAIRNVHLAGGATVRERFDVVDAAAYRLEYAGVPPMPIPVDDYRAAIQLSALGPRLTQVEWSSTGVPNGASLADLRSMLETLHAALIDGTRRLSEG